MEPTLAAAAKPREERPRLAQAFGQCVTSAKSPLGVALIVGLILRYVLAPFTAWPHDDAVWFQAAVSGQHQLGLYALSEFPYPPFWGLLLEGLGQIMSHLGLSSSSLAVTNPSFTALNQSTQDYADVITTPIFNILFKSILFAFDLGAGLLIRQMVTDLNGDQRRSDFAFALWFLNPFVLFESAMFGGFDVINAFFILATIVLLFHRRYAWAGTALGLGLLTKLSPIFLLPLIVVIVLHPNGREYPARARLGNLFAFGSGLIASVVVVLAPVVAGGTHPRLCTARSLAWARESPSAVCRYSASVRSGRYRESPDGHHFTGRRLVSGLRLRRLWDRLRRRCLRGAGPNETRCTPSLAACSSYSRYFFSLNPLHSPNICSG